MTKLWGREPAVWLALIAAIVMGGSTFLWHLSADRQGVINAVAVAVFGIITAASVHQGMLAAVVGGFKAVIALAIAFGLHLTGEQQLVIMTIVTAIGATFVRTQMIPKTTPVKVIDGIVVPNAAGVPSYR
jgi:hypothetical protein